MHKFNMKEKLPCTARELFERSLCNFDEYAKFSPNVSSVNVVSREKQSDGREKVVVDVHADGQLPAITKIFINQKGMNWREFYVIDMEKLSVEWNVESPIFTDYVKCKGTSFARDVNGGSEVVVTGDMTILAPDIKGVPTPVIQAAIGIMEPFIGRMVTVNLKEYFDNVGKAIIKDRKAAIAREKHQG